MVKYQYIGGNMNYIPKTVDEHKSEMAAIVKQKMVAAARCHQNQQGDERWLPVLDKLNFWNKTLTA